MPSTAKGLKQQSTFSLNELAMKVSELTSRHLPVVLKLLNKEYEGSYDFIPFDNERVLSQIRQRDLKVLVAEENEKVLGVIGTHTHNEENFEEHISWLAVDNKPNQRIVENLLISEVENRAKGDSVITMIDEGSSKINAWISRGYKLCPGFLQMSAKLDGSTPIPKIDANIKLRSLMPDEEEELVAAINAGFGWQRLHRGVLEFWKSEDSQFSEDWVQVAEVDGRIVSAVVARPDTEYIKYLHLKRGHLGPAATLPEFRNKHLASALTAKSMNFLYKKGMNSARLGTSEQNISSITLLRKLGFQVNIVRKILRKNIKKMG